MSLILDALKKSEQERMHGQTPGLNAQHGPITIHRNSNGIPWGMIAIVLVILQVCAIAWWISQKEQTSSAPSSPQSTALQRATPQTEGKPVPQPPAATKPAMTKTTTALLETPDRLKAKQEDSIRYLDQSPAAESSNTDLAKDESFTTYSPSVTVPTANQDQYQAIDLATMPTIFHLDPSIKQNIPALRFSFHVFSDDPQARRIVINNRNMAQGQRISHNLTLEQITQSGVVLKFDGHVFQMAIVDEWTP